MKQVFLRHKNGGGRKYGNDCEVDAATFLDRASSVGDSAEVRNSTITEGSMIGDNSIIASASIRNSYIHGESLILGAGPLYVSDSDLNSVRAWDNPSIQNCHLSRVAVFGDAVLENVTVDVHIRIHAGYWSKAPRYAMLSAPGLDVSVSECSKDRFHAGCWCHPWVTWANERWRQRIGRAAGWPPELVEEGFQWFQMWRG